MTLTDSLGSPRLQRLAQGRPSPPTPEPARERCDLCAAVIDDRHRHLVDPGQRALLCACRACAVLFDRQQAGARRYRLIPQRCRRLENFRLEDAGWEALGVPVAVAFFVRLGDRKRVVAFCPSAIGTTEAAVDEASWARLEADNPVLASLEPDVEALLVNRARGAREHWLAPIDVCYRLAAVVRTQWKGLSGGQEVWAAMGRFFETLAEKGDR